MSGRMSRPRRWLAPEVVQTSAMDCGPAALKCLLAGHGVSASYGRLREACQTSVDGTSIDAIESVALQLGLGAEQVLVPADFVWNDAALGLPALAVVQHADHFTHFVVIWARHGQWLQIMDPAVGRRWISRARFAEEMFTHHQSVDARDWRSWCDSAEFAGPMVRRMESLGIAGDVARELVELARAEPGWFGYGTLDAAVRLAAALVAASGLRRGEETARTVAALLRDTLSSDHDIFAVIPRTYWSAIPDIANTDPTREMLLISGSVLLRTHRLATAPANDDPLPEELAAALGEASESALARCWRMLAETGPVRPWLIGGAVLLQAFAVLLEALVMRGLLQIADLLTLPMQRVMALGALVLLLVATGLVDLGLARMAIRLGRRLEIALRQALLAKLARLDDRYFQSRPITDMADRSHMIHTVRALPPLAVQMLQAVAALVLTALAIILLSPGSALPVLGAIVVAMGMPVLIQPLLGEQDLRVRNHGGALHGFYLDALLGLAPIRAHRAQAAVSRQHEALLVQWSGAARGLARWGLVADAAQSLITTALACGLLIGHFAAATQVSGTDLLLVFWVLRLPGMASAVGAMARRYPMIRNAVLRQTEPLDAPEAPMPTASAPIDASGPVAISIAGATVRAGGHAILHNVSLSITPGEHVAIVGPSGAGKSSLLGVLLGWHRVAAGAVTVDGAPLDPAMLEHLRRRTAWVDPQVQLWNRSLLENLAYAAEDHDLGRMRDVLDSARLAGVIARLPGGLQSPLGESGGLLSGGEGQRVRLGRAQVSGDTRLVLLDEPFRGLDRDQRGGLLRSAREWWQGQTLLCVTHDIAETMDFPRVLVVEDGTVVEDGAPAALAAGPSRFRDLLEAERRLRAGRWGDSRWRHWHVSNGCVTTGAEADRVRAA